MMNYLEICLLFKHTCNIALENPISCFKPGDREQYVKFSNNFRFEQKILETVITLGFLKLNFNAPEIEYPLQFLY